MSHTLRLTVASLIVLVLVGCDQATKLYAVANFKGQPQQQFLGDTVRIQYAENPGAFLSLMATWSDSARFVVLTVLNSIVLVIVAAYLIGRPKLDWLSLTAFALILAGGIGNLIDRVRLDGIVIDFLNVGVRGLRTGIFNVADVAIMAGFFLLLGLAIFRPDEPQTVAENAEKPFSSVGTGESVA